MVGTLNIILAGKIYMKKIKLIISFLIAVLATVGVYNTYGTSEAAVWVLAWSGWLTVFFNELDKT